MLLDQNHVLHQYSPNRVVYTNNGLPGGGGLQSCRKTKENNGACQKSAVNVNKNMLFDPQFGYLGLES